jgi:hypothetical protein
MIKQKLRGSSLHDFEEESVNPMEGVANLSDAMLVLAVGMMLALIVAWNVDVFHTSPEETETSSVTEQDVVEVQEEETTQLERTDDSTDGESPDDYGLTEAGTVYRDADGNLYILEE